MLLSIVYHGGKALWFQKWTADTTDTSIRRKLCVVMGRGIKGCEMADFRQC